ncbi:hypothetical protein BDN72DRAFT_892605 [Pluteus cervinus]|uniref:Uncharacterized protein n=1 Tax=Pluteus cervinus TaxID=181527 RepID=A0ACD3B9A2_9AGAR|nr:hypothetical protein BDN72DRAFT_892605 [Pluteus cervinus]
MPPQKQHLIAARPPQSTHQDQDDDDDDDNHICPVCDGECTCPTQRPPPRSAPLRPASPASLKPKLPSLKIKLTVPPNMLLKRSAPIATPASRSAPSPLTSAYVPSPILHKPPKPSQSAPKRRGRPPKSAGRITTRTAGGAEPPAVTPPSMSRLVTRRRPASSPHKTRSSVSRLASKFNPKPPISRRPPVKRKRTFSPESDPDSSSSEFSDHDQDTQFPTFVSASAISSNDTDCCSSSSSSSDFDSDSSIEAEEEQFILSEENRTHDKARVRRELLGDDDPRRRKYHNDWVIRPRKKSVAGSDVDMDGESDQTEDDAEAEQDDDDEPDDEDDEETDGRATDIAYAALIDGESSLDADLFFANLSDSGESTSSSISPSNDEGGEDGDQSDLDGLSSEVTASGYLPPPPENLPFEVTEGWDGRIVFTNGLRDGQGIIDLDFEVNATRFVSHASSGSSSQETDVEMSVATEPDEEGYEQDEDGGEGDTTDEELVGDDDLPNDRAMRLVHFPFGVSAINPMSTMSPTVSPSPRDRRPFDSPNPSDILAGKPFCLDFDGPDYPPTTPVKQVRSSRGCFPRPGVFTSAEKTRQVIIDDTHNNIPSPHPRFPGRGRSISRLGRHNVLENLLRRHLNPSTLSTASSPSLQLISQSDIGTASPELAPAVPIDLDDVLEVSFLDPDPFESPAPIPASDVTDEDPTHDVDMARWDEPSGSAFRQNSSITDDTPAWASDTLATPSTHTDYGKLMKASPLSPMLWQNKAKRRNRGRKNKNPMAISPVLLPVNDDCTLMTSPSIPIKNQQKEHQKTRKEIRRERKLKRKSYNPIQHRSQPHNYHQHQHHPNMKSRSTAAVQRSSFNSPSSVPTLNI